jgi:O-acetyl-ADP-ribose deacetylase (regulator of RNase III)
MIRYVSGDLLQSQAQAIAHGVAPNDDFGQGLAHALREQQPAMYKDFRHYCQTQHPKAGGLWTWAGAQGPRVVALFTQEGAYDHGAKPGKATASNVNHALKALAAECTREGWTSLALPRLATGVGGMDWDEVKPLVEQHLGGLAIPVLVYDTFHPGQRADEKLAAGA